MTHPDDGSLRYVGISNTGRLPKYITSSKSYKNWLKKKQPIYNIIDHVLYSESDFWLNFYTSLFTSWGFKLILPEFQFTGLKQKTTELNKLIQISISNHSGHLSYLENTNSFTDVEELIVKLNGISHGANQKSSQNRLIREIHLILALILFNGQTIVQILKFRFDDILMSGELYANQEILPINTYVRSSCQDLFIKYPYSQFVFQELNKLGSRNSLHQSLPVIVNNLSIYFGLNTRLTNQYGHVFGKMLYMKTNGLSTTVNFLCRYYKCSTRLELLCILKLVRRNKKESQLIRYLYLG